MVVPVVVLVVVEVVVVVMVMLVMMCALDRGVSERVPRCTPCAVLRDKSWASRQS